MMRYGWGGVSESEGWSVVQYIKKAIAKIIHQKQKDLPEFIHLNQNIAKFIPETFPKTFPELNLVVRWHWYGALCGKVGVGWHMIFGIGW